MGIITDVKSKLSAVKTDVLTPSTQLRTKQLKELEAKRISYLSGSENVDAEENQILVNRNIGAAGIEIHQAYLEKIKSLYVPVDLVPENYDYDYRMRYFDITRWVTDSEEQNLDKLINVYETLSDEDCCIALIYHRSCMGSTVTLGIANTDNEQVDPTIADSIYERLNNAIVGNFPGVEIGKRQIGIPEVLKNGTAAQKSIAVVSNVSSEKSEKFISQSIEKLLDGFVPKEESQEYSIALIAKPNRSQLEQKNRIFELYTKLKPFETWQKSTGYNESEAQGTSASRVMNFGLSIAQTVGVTTGANASGGVPGIVHVSASIQTSSSTTIGANFGLAFSRSSNVTETVGKNESVNQSHTNYGIKYSLDLLEQQLKRIDESSALGMWDFAAYFLSADPVIANNIARMYLALTQGEDSYINHNAVALWDGAREKNEAAIVEKYVKTFQHPILSIREDAEKAEEDWLQYPMMITPSTVITGKELARALNFPRKSIVGLPVIETVSFGREVQHFDVSENETHDDTDEQIDIGAVVHMYHKEKNRVTLDIDSLTSHTFVTGSTGAGKSNAIYQIIERLKEKKKNILVIEPAKGEYVTKFGDTFEVFGTNPQLSKLLRINPFEFPYGNEYKKPVHVLEHIDRLIGIISACWPMYAAMPAVLKEAIEQAYVEKGWDLRTNECNSGKFPTFSDLLGTLPKVIENSMYSKDTKSDYSGALVTRVNSLTNGINGLIFCSDNNLSEKELFEKDVIIDLSRIGLTETRSLLMGILIMKLQEHRMAEAKINDHLGHVTVLEEAHNILRGVSASNSSEGANIQGKSVEMITNSIAEMRTYGEGFIIADQAPGLLDEAIIRNTNTKIIMRLPDAKDREIVGKAAALSDNQIKELAKLPRGVAAIYQNDWVEAVLCKFEKYDKIVKVPRFIPQKIDKPFIPKEDYFKVVFGLSEAEKFHPTNIEKIGDWINVLPYPSGTKESLRAALSGSSLSQNEQKSAAYNLFGGKKIALSLRDSIDTRNGIEQVEQNIKDKYDFTDDALIVRIRQLVLDYILEHIQSARFEQRYLEFSGRGVL